MALTYRRINQAGTGGGGGGTGTPYSEAFTTATWSLVSGNYEITVLASNHDKGTAPGVQVYEDITSTLHQVTVDIKISISGDVTISIPASPDNRFNGKIVILE
jgi:hypothetical protein